MRETIAWVVVSLLSVTIVVAAVLFIKFMMDIGFRG